jgi:hypothetical protein
MAKAHYQKSFVLLNNPELRNGGAPKLYSKPGYPDFVIYSKQVPPRDNAPGYYESGANPSAPMARPRTSARSPAQPQYGPRHPGGKFLFEEDSNMTGRDDGLFTTTNGAPAQFRTMTEFYQRVPPKGVSGSVAGQTQTGRVPQRPDFLTSSAGASKGPTFEELLQRVDLRTPSKPFETSELIQRSGGRKWVRSPYDLRPFPQPKEPWSPQPNTRKKK